MARGLGMTALRAALGGVAGYGQDVAIRRERERLEAERARELARQEAADVRQRELDRIGMLDKGYMTPEEAGAERQAGGAALSRALASASGMLAGRGAPAFGQGIGAGDGTAIVRGMGQVGPQQRATLGGQQFTRESPVAAALRTQEMAANRERMGEERKQAQARTEKQQQFEADKRALVAAGETPERAEAALRMDAKYGDLFMSPAQKADAALRARQVALAERQATTTGDSAKKAAALAAFQSTLPSLNTANERLQQMTPDYIKSLSGLKVMAAAKAPLLANKDDIFSFIGASLANMASDPKAREYASFVRSVTDAVARASEVGVLTNQDIARYQGQILFMAGDSAEDRMRKFTTLKQWSSWLANKGNEIASGKTDGVSAPPPDDITTDYPQAMPFITDARKAGFSEQEIRQQLEKQQGRRR
jgi:hypothetical protein